MIKRHLALALSVVITVVSLGLPLTAKAQSNSEADKIRSKVHTLSASKSSQVQVKFRDGTKLKGYIDAVEPLNFTLRDPRAEQLNRSLIPRSRALARPVMASVQRPG